MRYAFANGSDGNLNDPANWQPAGGPPGTGDVAVFKNGRHHSETLHGTASVGALEFYGGVNLNHYGYFLLDGVTLTASMPLGAQFAYCYATLDNGALTTGLLELTGAYLNLDDSALQTSRTVVGTNTEAGWNSTLLVTDSTWTNTGGVVLSSSPDSQQTMLDISRSTATIGGDMTADAGYYTAVSILESSVSVAGNVVLSASSGFFVERESLVRIDGNLLVNATGATGSGPLGGGQASVDAGTIDVGGDVVIGRGAAFSAGIPGDGGVLRAEGSVRILDGGTGSVDGTIETNTMVLQPMAFLSGPVPGAFGPPAIIEGLDGGNATIFNQGTIETQGTLTIDGNVTEHGMLLVGHLATTTGDMAVNGTVTTQGIRFGAPGSQFFAQDFGVGNAALHFLQGDTLATPDIASIGFDAASNTLTIDKQSGAVEHLSMGGVDYTGQQFTLTNNEFITLQPASA